MADSLYRKYRPSTFEDIVGQEHIVKTLKGAIDSGRVSHAYLFCGPRGTGKTTAARILAKALLCVSAPTSSPDGTCEECKLIAEAQHPDVSELDAASRTGVDSVREEIISRVNFAPTRGKFKVYIIDEVHMLSNAAFNALLKTLEEPPNHVVFILCTTDPQKVPETIHSRCQRFDFRKISVDELTGRLGAVCNMENVEFEGEALDLISRRSDGGLRDALTSLEQAITYGDGKVTLQVAQDLLGTIDNNDTSELVEAIARRDVASCFNYVEKYVDSGGDLGQFVDEFAMHFRNIYVFKLAGCDVAFDVSENERESLSKEIEMFDESTLSFILSIFATDISNVKSSANQRLAFELMLIRLTNATSISNFEALNERLANVEKSIKPQGSVQPAISRGSKNLRQERENVATEKSVTEKRVPPSSKIQVVQSNVVEKTQEQPVKAEINVAVDDELWQKVISELQKSSPSVGCIALSASPLFDEKKNIFTLAFAPDKQFAFAAMQKPASKESVVAALEKNGIVGATVEVIKSSNHASEGLTIDQPANKTKDKIVKPEKQNNQVDELNDILSGAFGEGARFREL